MSFSGAAIPYLDFGDEADRQAARSKGCQRNDLSEAAEARRHA
jgi:hypothetical protein